MGRTHTHSLKFPCSTHILMPTWSSNCRSKLDTAKCSWTKRNSILVHSQYDEVFWSVWLKCKFLTVENFESISFTSLSVDFCRFDGDREQAGVLHSEGSFESEVWLLDFCLWNKWRNNIEYIVEEMEKCTIIYYIIINLALTKTVRLKKSLY